MPAGWAGRRITLTADYLNSYAVVYVDGKKAGEMRFPAGEVDLSAACKPGQKHVLSIFVVAMPLKAVMMSYNDTNSAKSVKGSIERRGLCGDVYLVSEPQHARITDVRVETSVRKGEIAFDAALDGLAPDATYALCAQVLDASHAVTTRMSKPFKAADLKDGRFEFSGQWKAEKLWDLNTPQNTYQANVSLVSVPAAARRSTTAFPVRFGVPRVLDRRPRLLPERVADLALVGAVGQRPGGRGVGHVRCRQGKPAAPEDHGHQHGLYA